MRASRPRRGPTSQQIAGRASAAKRLAASAATREKIHHLRSLCHEDGRPVYTLDEIGSEVGLSRQRVHQILERVRESAA